MYRQNIGAVFQDHHLLPNRTVYDNVALPLRVSGMPERDVSRRARAALSRVGLLEKEHLLPPHLSTGEQQRVGIARAVVNRPRLLLADEPTGNLDPELSRDIMRLFEQFQEVGTTVIIASHERELIAAMGKPIVELSHGVLAEVSEGARWRRAATRQLIRGARPGRRPLRLGWVVGRAITDAWRATA